MFLALSYPKVWQCEPPLLIRGCRLSLSLLLRVSTMIASAVKLKERQQLQMHAASALCGDIYATGARGEQQQLKQQVARKAPPTKKKGGGGSIARILPPLRRTPRGWEVQLLHHESPCGSLELSMAARKQRGQVRRFLLLQFVHES